MDCSLLGSSVSGIFQARFLEWVAISFSRDLPYPGIKPTSLEAPALASRFFTTEPSGKPCISCSVQFSSVAQSCLTLRDPMNCTRSPCLSPTPGVYSNSSIESVMPSSHLILCRPLLLRPPIPPSIRVFSNESTFHLRWREFELQHQSFQ